MKKIALFLICFVSIHQIVLGQMNKITQDFSLQMMKNLIKEEGNILISPLSISASFAMLHPGAKGITKMKIDSIFHSQSLFDNFSSYLKELKTRGNSSFQLSNALIVQSGIKLDSAYEKKINTNLPVSTMNVDFSSPTSARDLINLWVKNQTKDRIKEIVTTEDLNQTIVLILNVLTFDGQWQNQFDPTLNQEGIFDAKGSNTKCTYMNAEFAAGFSENKDLIAVNLAYKNSDYSMLLVQSKEESLDKLLSENSKQIADLIDKKQFMKVDNIKIMMPRFEFEYQIMIDDYLRKQRLGDVFANQADYSGVVAEGLKIDKVIHKTMIKVIETGTQAAAATAISGVRSLKSKTITLDKPFLFFITSNTDNTILFSGCLKKTE